MKEDTTTIDPTWMQKTGGYAKDMTMRDELAARAMQGLITNNDYDWIQGEKISKIAYSMADAMLKAREAK
jgi:hypothetical protein